MKIQLKGDAKLIEQKGRPIPIHLQQLVEKEIEKLIKQGHIEKANNIDENCFVSPAVITVKKDKSVKMALDSRKLNEITVKRKAQMPNMEELISRISRKIADGPADEIWISKFDLDYAYGQLILLNPTIARQATGDKRIKTTEQRERAKIISGSHPVFVKIH